MSSHGDDRDPGGESPSSSSESLPRQFAPITRGDSEESSSRPQTTGLYGTMRPSDSLRPGEGPAADPARTPTASPPMGPPTERPQQPPKKPPTVRRASSKPYRGQEFSVDDDVDEYEEDNAIRQAPSSPRPGGRPQQASSLRRRQPTARTSSSLRRVDSRAGGEPEGLAVTFDGSNEDARSVPRSIGREGADGGDSSNEAEDNDDNNNDDVDEDDDASDISDAESFTLKDRQLAINQTHPFGIRIWKPALYKKFRSVERTAEGDIHSVPGERVSIWLFLVNISWTIFFGWWLGVAALFGSIVCFLFSFAPHAAAYGRVFLALSGYLVWPFGSFVRLESDEHYAEEDEGEGRSISEYEQWQSGDLEHGRLFFGPITGRSLVGRRRSSVDSAASEHDSLLGRAGRRSADDRTLYRSKRRFFGRGEWTLGRVIFYLLFYFLVGPLMLFVSLVCWLLVFWIPMARVTNILFNHLRRHPLALSFHTDSTYSRFATRPSSSSILLCTYRAAGIQYWKYTIDGTNIFLINLLAMVVFVILDYFLLNQMLGFESWLTHPGLMFPLALLSVIPLAYFIGQAVASISAQSSMGLGAAVNAFFSTVVEVYLYCVALTEGKAQLVEGSIIGSIFAGILFLPGLSMCFGAIKRKTQRFNVKSAGVTSTMLLFAVIAAFGPTLFYKVYGSHELNCRPCASADERDCRRCYFLQVPELQEQFFLKAVQPYSWFAAVLLFLSYIIGLWFTLRTHAAVIWATEPDEKKTSHLPTPAYDGSQQRLQPHHPSGLRQGGQAGQAGPKGGSVRDSPLYTRILGQSLAQVGLSAPKQTEEPSKQPEADGQIPHVVPPNGTKGDARFSSEFRVPGLSEEQNNQLVRRVTEVAATAATVAARDATRTKKPSAPHQAPGAPGHGKQGGGTGDAMPNDPDEPTVFADQHHSSADGGHDAPNWSKTKSSAILLVATVAYAVIAEILVNTVDVVLESVDIDEKFLGITLFSLVPNTTEFLNAISFAMNGNIALSMEIGSAYALQVCLLQIPALVLFSAVHSNFLGTEDMLSHSFNLIFPQWDMITVILCVFLLSYVYGEGKSNYFKGSILVLTYIFVVAGFYLSRFAQDSDGRGIDRYDTLAVGERERLLLASAGLGG